MSKSPLFPPALSSSVHLNQIPDVFYVSDRDVPQHSSLTSRVSAFDVVQTARNSVGECADPLGFSPVHLTATGLTLPTEGAWDHLFVQAVFAAASDNYALFSHGKPPWWLTAPSSKGMLSRVQHTAAFWNPRTRVPTPGDVVFIPTSDTQVKSGIVEAVYSDHTFIAIFGDASSSPFATEGFYVARLLLGWGPRAADDVSLVSMRLSRMPSIEEALDSHLIVERPLPRVGEEVGLVTLGLSLRRHFSLEYPLPLSARCIPSWYKLAARQISDDLWAKEPDPSDPFPLWLLSYLGLTDDDVPTPPMTFFSHTRKWWQSTRQRLASLLG